MKPAAKAEQGIGHATPLTIVPVPYGRFLTDHEILWTATVCYVPAKTRASCSFQLLTRVVATRLPCACWQLWICLSGFESLPPSFPNNSDED